ncbi:MAG: DUF1738 domain-containing protein [Alphaproteobacteria bacterium]|nr:DUF1738 domain-containing protein [Alphaproteobacteria bacterium]
MTRKDDWTPKDHYQEVTNRIVQALEQGTPPWRRPWDQGIGGLSGPVNASTGRRYRGINVLLLGSNPRAFETGDPRWCSYKQAQENGWQVRGGEKASTIFFFKRVELKGDGAVEGDNDNDDDRKTVPVLRSYPVFHASQMDGIPAYKPPTVEEAPWREPEAVRAILDASGVPVRVGGDRAFYSPSTDHIQMPVAQAFGSAEGWSATALHELGHATGHPSRLNRDLRGRFGSAAYAMEELRAELASVFMQGELGVGADIHQHAAYIDSWLDALRKDKREIFRAAGDAQRIADWCLSRHPAYRAAMEAEADMDGVSIPVIDSSREPVAAAAEMPEHLRRKLGMMPPQSPPPTDPAAVIGMGM